jgi:hypothetical protein
VLNPTSLKANPTGKEQTHARQGSQHGSSSHKVDVGQDLEAQSTQLLEEEDRQESLVWDDSSEQRIQPHEEEDENNHKQPDAPDSPE